MSERIPLLSLNKPFSAVMRMNYKIILGLGLVLFFLGCVGTNTQTPSNGAGTATGTTPPASNGQGNSLTIQMANGQFTPGNITASQGTILHFTNTSPVAHDMAIIREDGTFFFEKVVVEAGQSMDVTLTETGSFALECERHLPGMVGTIQVQ